MTKSIQELNYIDNYLGLADYFTKLYAKMPDNKQVHLLMGCLNSCHFYANSLQLENKEVYLHNSKLKTNILQLEKELADLKEIL